MSIAACQTCGAKENVRCVNDHCCERDDRDAVFLGSVGQSWQFEANRLLDAWAEATAESHRCHAAAAACRIRVDRARDEFDRFIARCVNVRADVAA